VLNLSTQVQMLLDKAVADGAFPCASVAILRHGTTITELAVGRETFAPDAPRSCARRCSISRR